MKSILIALIGVCSALSSIGQIKSTTDPKLFFGEPKGHGLGLVISSSNGKGLTYRYMPGRNGFHVSFFPASSQNSNYYSANVTGYHVIFGNEKNRLFLHTGLEYNSSKDTYYSYVYPNGKKEINENISHVNVGVGPGYELKFGYFSLDVYLGYAMYIKSGNSTGNGQYLNMSGGIGLFFNF
jgi:hypothetical protein